MEAASLRNARTLVRDGDVPATPTQPGAADAAGAPGVAISGVVACACCRRAPLVGETVTLRGRGPRLAWVCTMCEGTRRRKARRLGPAERTERVRSLGGAMNVRRA